MKILAARIKRRLLFDTGKWGHCPIYENELQRIWPLNEEHRKAKIEQFAKEYGFCLSLYKPGLCAIFEKERPGWAEKTQDLVVRDKEGTSLQGPLQSGERAVAQRVSERAGQNRATGRTSSKTY